MLKHTRKLAILMLAAALTLWACDPPAEEATETEEEAAVETEETEEAQEEEVAEEPQEIENAVGLEAPEDVAAVPDDAEVTESGLASKVIAEGHGTVHPSPTDTVTVHYSGWTLDGERFDSSVARGAPTSFPLNRVIAGWTEGVQLMVVGEARRFWIPADLAYGENPAGGAPGGMLVFEVQLLEIN